MFHNLSDIKVLCVMNTMNRPTIEKINISIYFCLATRKILQNITKIFAKICNVCETISFLIRFVSETVRKVGTEKRFVEVIQL